jgi:hypothetical protein
VAPGREPDQQDHGVRQFPSREIRQQQQLCGYGYYSNDTINSTSNSTINFTGLAYLEPISSNSNFGAILLIAQVTTAGLEIVCWTHTIYGGHEDLHRDSCCLNCRSPPDAVGAAVSQSNPMAVRSRELSWSRPHA